MRQSPPSVGRSIVTLLIMVIAFAALGALFLVLDSAAGLHVSVPALLAASTPTATPRPSATPTPRPSPTPPASTPTAGAAAPLSGTATAAAILPTSPAIPTGTTATPLPTPPGGISPPIYGTLPNYTNNTTFSPTFMQSLDAKIIALTNDERARRGLSKLSEDSTLDIIAAARSQDMVKRRYFDHYDPTGPVDAQGHPTAAVQELLSRNGVSYTEVGENLVGNTGFPLDQGTPQQVVQAWMHHTEHRDNILHPSYTLIGVGMAAENQSNGLRVVITQIFLR